MGVSGRQPGGRWRVHVASLPPRGRAIDIEASEAEKDEIAAAHELVGLSSFSVRLRLVPAAGEAVRLSGHLTAEVEQTCVVSLRSVAARIDLELHRLFVPSDRLEPDDVAARRGERDVVVELDEGDPPEPFDGVSIDLRPVLLEEFALALDPYPRLPDAVQEGGARGAEAAAGEGAFAALKALRGRGKGE